MASSRSRCRASSVDPMLHEQSSTCRGKRGRAELLDARRRTRWGRPGTDYSPAKGDGKIGVTRVKRARPAGQETARSTSRPPQPPSGRLLRDGGRRPPWCHGPWCRGGYMMSGGGRLSARNLEMAEEGGIRTPVALVGPNSFRGEGPLLNHSDTSRRHYTGRVPRRTGRPQRPPVQFGVERSPSLSRGARRPGKTVDGR